MKTKTLIRGPQSAKGSSSSKAKRLLAVALLVLAGSVTFTSFAAASAETFFHGYVAAGARKSGASKSGLTSTAVVSESTSKKAQAGAHYPGGNTLYASWAEAFSFVCHSYSGSNTLGGMLQNKHSIAQNPMTGGHSWNGGGC